VWGKQSQTLEKDQEKDQPSETLEERQRSPSTRRRVPSEVVVRIADVESRRSGVGGHQQRRRVGECFSSLATVSVRGLENGMHVTRKVVVERVVLLDAILQVVRETADVEGHITFDKRVVREVNSEGAEEAVSHSTVCEVRSGARCLGGRVSCGNEKSRPWTCSA
jgi:hypothetical protein